MIPNNNQERNFPDGKYHLEQLLVSEFNSQELSILKLLVLENLHKYDDVNVAEESGNIYVMLLQLLDKIHYLQKDNKGYRREKNSKGIRH